MVIPSWLKKIVARLKNTDSSLRHVSLIAGGTIIAQIINIVTVPIISRIYSPNDYGLMAVYTSVVAILGELSGFRYHFAIPLPKQNRYAEALVFLSLLLQFVFVSLLTLLLFFSGGFLLKKMSIPELISYRALIPVGLLVSSTYICLTQWAIREKLFSTIGQTKVTQSLIGGFIKIVLGIAGIRPLGLLIGTIFSQGGGITTLLRPLLKKRRIPRPKIKSVSRVAIRYRKFPMYEMWSGLLNTIGRQIVPILLVSFFCPQIAGLYAVAQHLLQVPAVFVGQAIGQVFLQRASVAKFKGNLKELVLRTYLLLLKIGLYPVLLISLFAPQIFSFFLGERWIEAGYFALVLGPWIAFVFAYSPLSMLYSILDRQRIGFIFEIIYNLCRIFAFWAGSFTQKPIISLSLFSGVGFILLFIRVIDLLVASGNGLKKVLLESSKVMVEAFILLSVPYFVLIFEFDNHILLLAILISLLLFILRVVKFLLSRYI